MSSSDEQDPPLYLVNSVELSSVKNSKISGVSVYSGRAEITRIFKVNLKSGQNEVVINGLPAVLDEHSLRVEGRGTATIQDVTVSWIPRPVAPTSSPALTELLAKKERVQKAVDRCKNSISSVEAYLATLHVQHIEISKLSDVMKGYDSTAEELDLRLLDLEAEQAKIDEELNAERHRLVANFKEYNEKLTRRATIGIFSDEEGEVQLMLIYAVNRAAWTALYDIRVNMQAKDQPVVLSYKASIIQYTGEDWKDVPLTLETATPTFGVEVPKLEPWTLSLHQPPPMIPGMMGGLKAAKPPPPPPPRAMASRAPSLPIQGRTRATAGVHLDEAPAMAARAADVSSKGNVSATFQVPGMISIPSDGTDHKVTIADLKLSATMTWVCVPKKDTKTRLNAKIKNNSQYTLLIGKSSVYIDGSFVARTSVPAVNPEESFNIPLGLDPSIRVTYHPQTRKQGQSGFYNKTVHHVFTQNITVHNTKAISVDGVKIIDQLPISEDSQIQVKLVNPTLSAPSGTNGVSPDMARRPVTITNGVNAMWDSADDLDADVETLGKTGKFNWVCSIPAQSKTNLTLQWEVTVPPKTHIAGLMLAVCSP